MTDAPASQIVFTEVPATDPVRARAFYETLLQAPLMEDNAGPNPIWIFPHADGQPAMGHLYPGKPAKDGEGITVHFTVPDALSQAMERVTRGGGTIVSGVIDIYSGAFFYARDTEGNSIGIFRYKD